MFKIEWVLLIAFLFITLYTAHLNIRIISLKNKYDELWEDIKRLDEVNVHRTDRMFGQILDNARHIKQIIDHIDFTR